MEMLNKDEEYRCRRCGKNEQENGGELHSLADLYWCEDHRHLGELLLWAGNHQFPAIKIVGIDQNYAIGAPNGPDNAYLWERGVFQGSEDMVWSTLSTVMSLSENKDEESA